MRNGNDSSDPNGGPPALVDGAAAMHESDDAVDIAVRRLDLPLEYVRRSATLLSDAEQRKANRFAFDRDRRRFIVARAWLRRLLAAKLGARPESIELKYGKYGKPFICGALDLRFNVSHADNVAVYAFARGREIGVDVERIRWIDDADAIASHYFSGRERGAYLALDPREKPLGFFNCWTRKEAFIKALGDGLHHPLHDFDVSLAPGETAKILRVRDMSGDDCGWRLSSFYPAAGFVAAVVCESRRTRPASISPHRH
jgi:4'-phosphopantetheinyl transferase